MKILGIEEVNAHFNDGLRKLTLENITFWLGRPSVILLSTGIQDKEIKFYGNKIIKKANKHGFNPLELKDLPKVLNDPIAVFDDKKYGGHTILIELKIKGNNVLVALDGGKGTDENFNIIKSTFGKSFSNIIRWLNNNSLLYVNKEKALDYLRTPAPIAGVADSQELIIKPSTTYASPASRAGATDNQGSETLDYPGTPALMAGAADSQELITAENIVNNFKNPKLPTYNIT